MSEDDGTVLEGVVLPSERMLGGLRELTDEQAEVLRRAILRRCPSAVSLMREDLVDVALQLQLDGLVRQLRMDAADVVLALAAEGQPGVVVAERLTGRAMTRETASAASRVRRHLKAPSRAAASARDDPRVVVSVRPNPKIVGSGSWERYKLWEVGISVSQARERGLTAADVKYDIDRGFVVVEMPASSASSED